jgi:hypothetical protein
MGRYAADRKSRRLLSGLVEMNANAVACVLYYATNTLDMVGVLSFVP